MAVCPECENPLDIDEDEVEEGEVIVCDECGTQVEIIGLEPLQIATVDEAGYDDESSDLPATEDEDS
jgi:alpha-aminoadipate carrier protein LysW